MRGIEMCAIISIYLCSDQAGLIKSVFTAKLEVLREGSRMSYSFLYPQLLVCYVEGLGKIFHVCWLCWARLSLSPYCAFELVPPAFWGSTEPVQWPLWDRTDLADLKTGNLPSVVFPLWNRSSPCYFSFSSGDYVHYFSNSKAGVGQEGNTVAWSRAGEDSGEQAGVCPDWRRPVPTHDCHKWFLVWCCHTFRCFKRNQMFIGHLLLFKYLWQAQKV